MLTATVSTIATALDGHWQGDNVPCCGVSIDSRQITPGALFIAIAGQRFDGHDFIEQAKKQGAAAVLVHKPVETDLPSITVEDTRLALGRVAQWWRGQHDIDVIAVTGSCGKTTAKNLMVSILQQCKTVHATRGSLNNDYGVPLTLLGISDTDEVAVIEMGANHMNEIAYLSPLAQPDVAMITCVAPVHVEGFGSVPQIAQGKAEIFQGLRDDGTAIINRDDAFFDYWQTLLAGKKILSFGLSADADVRASDIQVTEKGSTTFQLHLPSTSLSINLPLLGEHNVFNALAAATACHALRIAPSAIQAGLQAATAETKRLVKRVMRNGCTVIDDSYSANPSSFKAALQVLSNHPGEKIVVMGDMAELGEEAKAYHRALAEQAKQYGVSVIYAMGELSQETTAAFGDKARHFSAQPELIAELEKIITPDMCVLVKGSRCMQMDKIVDALTMSDRR